MLWRDGDFAFLQALEESDVEANLSEDSLGVFLMLFGSQAQHFVALELDKFLGYFEWSKIAAIGNKLFFLCSVSVPVMFVKRFTSRSM